ncbi:hypothetical protein OTB20_23770 [Streptomyces sp. H27-H1]|uniref:hypothetical protein n=1 Tax=Streptomyces sp. H27-H1 TaxID=2996461 RepID=UPI0022712697|nr:hypothetical protein [Streptomyces sp. H27-H1]MCY0929160.1 hypothetical protein [Streptomyces sp. H27-H1]
MNEQLALLSERLHHEALAVPGPVQRLVTATAGTPTLDQRGSADALAVLGLGDDVPRFEAEAMD